MERTSWNTCCSTAPSGSRRTSSSTSCGVSAQGSGPTSIARTSYDETVYELTVPNDDDIVETGLDILEEWLSFATIDPDDVEAERGIVLDEWRSRSQTSNGRVFDELAAFHLAGSDYDGRTPIGGQEAIESITAEDLRRFYDDWYRPELASVIVVGEIDPEEVEAWIIDRFADATSRGDGPARRRRARRPGDDDAGRRRRRSGVG